MRGNIRVFDIKDIDEPLLELGNFDVRHKILNKGLRLYISRSQLNPHLTTLFSKMHPNLNKKYLYQNLAN